MVEASISFQGPNSAKIQSILFYSYLFNSNSTMMMNAFCIGIQYTENENQQVATKGDNFRFGFSILQKHIWQMSKSC